MHEVDWSSVKIEFSGQAQEELLRLGRASLDLQDVLQETAVNFRMIAALFSFSASVSGLPDACSPDTSQPYPF